jgi:formate-dependent nitrite reductase cytochrome c552 subunit
MKYPKFKLIQDLEVVDFFEEKITLYKEGDIFVANEDGKYIVNSPVGRAVFSAEQMCKASHDGELTFEEVKVEEINLIIEEIGDDDDNLVMSWRIQLDVKTTKKKLKEIEKIIRDYVTPIIN